MTVISNNNIAEAIYLAGKGKSHTEQPVFFKNVVEFLARKKLLSKAPDILARLDKIINDDEGKIVAKVSSVEKMNEATKKEIIRFALDIDVEKLSINKISSWLKKHSKKLRV